MSRLAFAGSSIVGRPPARSGAGRRADGLIVGHRLRLLLACLLALNLAGTARAELIARLRASWEEKDAKVEVFSPDGRYLISSGAEGDQLRDAATGKVTAVLAARPYRAYGMKFSPDGRLLFAKVNSERHRPVWVFDLKVWSVATGKERATFPYIAESLNVSTDDFALSADGKTLAFLDESERLPMDVQTSNWSFDFQPEVTIPFNASHGLPRVKVWDVPTWKERVTLDAGSPLVFSPDGTSLVTGARDWHDPAATIWDAATGRPRARFDSGAPWMKPLTFSPDGRFLVIGTRAKQELYELSSGRRWPVAAIGDPDGGASFSHDGRWLAAGGLPDIDPFVQGRAVRHGLYDLATLPPKPLELGSAELVISPDLRRYAALHGERYTGGPIVVAMHDLPSLREIGRVRADGLLGAGFSPGGRWLALLVGRNEERPGGPGTRYVREVRLIDPATARVMVTVPSPGETWGDFGWKLSPDGKTLAVHHRMGSNLSRPGDPDPFERPMLVELWEIGPR